MSKPVITVEKLSKSFSLRHQQPEGGYLALRDVLSDKVRSLFKPKKNSDPTTELFWALKNVSFEVNQGDRIGIIGRNGAGKSTLLKILSRIVAPTKGTITIEGRVASLLEVGTGFHPELTGRENIFLNGAILGMNKAEIKSKFEEIVDFSGVEKFLDTPVKRYSSGMYVRLAFAVAAHLEPEILIVDEVLAVGDAAFQKKCLGKMQDVSQSGRTILFVSHNMVAVKSLCDRAFVFEEGRLTLVDKPDSAIPYYISGGADRSNRKAFSGQYEKDLFTLHTIQINNTGNAPEEPLTENEAIEMRTDISLHVRNGKKYHITYHLMNEIGEPLFSFSSARSNVFLEHGKNGLICKFPKNFFQSGQFSLSLFVVEDRNESIFTEQDIFSFTVVDGVRDAGVYMGREPGSIRPTFEWANNIYKSK